MKIKNTSADFVKNISLFFLITMVGTIDAMDRIITLFRQQPDYVSRKESRIDFLKMHEIGPWYEKLSNKQKQKIENNLKKEDLALFYFATCCPGDTQRIIVTYMCKEDFEEKYAEEITKEFCGDISLCKAFCSYQFTKKVFKDKDKFNKHLAKDSSFQPHIIFKYAKEISVFDKWSKNKDFCLSKNELQSIEKVCKEFKSIDIDKIKYKFYESYTLDNFKKYCNYKQWLALPVLLLTFMMRLHVNFWGDSNSTYIRDDIVNKNKVRDFINLSLQNKYNETADPIWLSEKKELEDPVGIYWGKVVSFWSIFSSSVFSGALLGAKMDNDAIDNISVRSFLIGFGSSIGSLGMSILFKVIICNTIPTLSERPILGISCVTGLYALIVAFYNIIKMRTLRKATVSLKELSELLKRTDIMIE